MRILAHRGFWRDPREKNTSIAFERAFERGYGIETDLRDYRGEIVVSHDIPCEGVMRFEALLALYDKYDRPGTLALNVKSDGLQDKLLKALTDREICDYFFFDMSVPDALGYQRRGLRFFTRESEHERSPAFYEGAQGVWLDAFESEWYKSDTIHCHLKNSKHVAVVSPELHGRKKDFIWKNVLNNSTFIDNFNVYLCTDYPEEAYEYFK